jgi:hypothetical protein
MLSAGAPHVNRCQSVPQPPSHLVSLCHVEAVEPHIAPLPYRTPHGPGAVVAGLRPVSPPSRQRARLDAIEQTAHGLRRALGLCVLAVHPGAHAPEFDECVGDLLGQRHWTQRPRDSGGIRTSSSAIVQVTPAFGAAFRGGGAEPPRDSGMALDILAERGWRPDPERRAQLFDATAEAGRERAAIAQGVCGDRDGLAVVMEHAPEKLLCELLDTDADRRAAWFEALGARFPYVLMERLRKKRVPHLERLPKEAWSGLLMSDNAEIHLEAIARLSGKKAPPKRRPRRGR